MLRLPYDYKHNVESKSWLSSEDAVKIVHQFNKLCGAGGIQIVGSCNSLVSANHAGHTFGNPCTAECKEMRSPFGFLTKYFGFDYDSKTCDYKFVSIYCQPNNGCFSNGDIYLCFRCMDI